MQEKMGNEYITTNGFVELLVRAGYRAIRGEDNNGKYINVYEGSTMVGGVSEDHACCLVINACLPEDRREHLLKILYDYAKTPIESRKEMMYTLRISETNLYLTSIDESEMTVVSDENWARLYSAADVSRAKELAKGHHTVLRDEESDATN